MVQAMDLSPTPTNTIKTPDTDTETPPEAQPTKSLSFTNGSLKRHHPQPPPPPTPPPPPSSMVVSYRECLKNHAASIGGHALDGCGEFMPCPTAIPTDPTSLKCAACGCHRNFHRREPDEPISGCKILSFYHHYPSPPLPPPIRPSHRSSSPSLSPSRSSSPGPTPSPHSPPPVSHLPPNSYFASPPQMLLALSTGFSGPSDEHHNHQHHHNQSFNQTAVMMKTTTENSNGRKRFRTKFSQEQKEKMHLFAEKVGWKMVKSDEGIVEEFCNEVGIGKGVLKVWMHNNKHTLGKRDRGNLEGNVDVDNNNNNNGGDDRVLNNEDRKADFNLFSNGSSSSPSS